MDRSTTQSLLRRTAAAVAAISAFLVAAPAVAQTNVTIPSWTACAAGGTFAVANDGSLILSCTGGTTTPPPPPPPPPVCTDPLPLTLSAPATANTTGVTVTVSGGTQTACAPIALTLAASAGCTIPPTATVPQGASSVTFSVVPSGVTSCSYGIFGFNGPGTAGTNLGTTTTFSAQATGGGGNTPQPGVTSPIPSSFIPAGCAPPPASAQIASLPAPNYPYIMLRAGSSQITALQLPALTPYNRQTAGAAFGETVLAGLPSNYTVDASFSPCPGIITTPSNGLDFCNFQGMTSTNGFTINWANSAAVARANLYCSAPDSPQVFLNVRWTFTRCGDGSSSCGFSVNTN